MRDPPGEEQEWGGGEEIGRFIEHCRLMHKMAYMVQCHDKHNSTADDIDGLEPLFRMK